MATWVEDIVQALKNLGGQAHQIQIADEVRRIREGELPYTWRSIVYHILGDYSSDSNFFKGKDLFKKVDKGVWALRDFEGDSYHAEQSFHHRTSSVYHSSKRKSDVTWTEDIIQALKNLGGQATLNQIYEEVSRIHVGDLPKSWIHIIQAIIYKHSSDTQNFEGVDLFKKIDRGVWALREYGGATHPSIRQFLSPRRTASFKNFIPPESPDEIMNILRTVKQYRDYQNPDNPYWKEYITEFFQILGFTTGEINSRLYSLDVIGSNHTPEAILMVLHPGENFEEMVPGLTWDSYCFFAARYYQTQWGIMTNGIQLKILSYDEREKIEPLYWKDIDQVVCNEQFDTFCSIYKVFSYIKEQKVLNKRSAKS